MSLFSRNRGFRQMAGFWARSWQLVFVRNLRRGLKPRVSTYPLRGLIIRSPFDLRKCNAPNFAFSNVADPYVWSRVLLAQANEDRNRRPAAIGRYPGQALGCFSRLNHSEGGGLQSESG